MSSIANQKPEVENPTTIGIAVVEHNGRYLVGTRGDDSPLAGCAEFPGGKCLPGETPQECARRECLEETGLDVSPVRLLLNTRFAYPHGEVDLHFWLFRPADPAQVGEQHNGFRWVAAAELPRCRFPEANRPLVEQLAGSRCNTDRSTRRPPKRDEAPAESRPLTPRVDF